jgi:hypothetical protein
MDAGPPVDDGTGLGWAIGIGIGGGVAGAGFEEVVGNGDGGLQPVCSESHSLERPPQLTVAVSAATATESAPPRSARELSDATPRRFHIGMA